MCASAVSPNDALSAAIERLRQARDSNHAAAAERATAELLDSFADSGRAWLEVARTRLAMGDGHRALEALRAAVTRNDALPDAWALLEALSRRHGLHAEASEARDCARRLAELPPAVAAASSLLNEGAVEAAERELSRYLQEHGTHAAAMRLLAQAAIKLRVSDDAELLLEHVLDMRPDWHEARFEYATVLLDRRRYLPALEQAQRLLRIESSNPNYLRLYAAACDGVGEGDEALRAYQHLRRLTPADPDVPLAIAHIHQTRGQLTEAAAEFEAACTLPASFARACFALSNQKAYRFNETQIARMIAYEARTDVTSADRYHVCYALGRALERDQDYPRSFEYYARGSALKRAEIKSDPAAVERTMERQRTICTRAFFHSRLDYGCPAPDPIFIVGMPRAGSTLLEQILASHSQVDGTLELPDIPRMVAEFRQRDPAAPPTYPAILETLTREECRLLGERYLAETRVHRRGAPFFVDKMPNNFRDLGFIHLILPNARIIDARREPMACCFSNFKQLFANGMEFKYTQEELGRYYRAYVQLMAHWETVLPGRIMRVQHETVIDDLEGSVRRLLAFLGLPFEDRCLEFYRTERTVRTVSNDQVRRPIFRESLDQWRHYEPWLGPLKAALGELVSEVSSPALTSVYPPK